MSGLGDAYAAMQPPRKCICGEYPQGHPSGLCDACVAKRSAPRPARRPCAGWVYKGVGGWRLKAGDVEATVHRMNGWSKVFMSHAPGRPMDVESDDVVTVLLAAEDALRAVAAEILRAVGA